MKTKNNYSDYMRRWAKRNPEKVRHYTYRRKYGIGIEEYKKLLNKQNSLCAICKQTETVALNGKIKKLSIDHSHKRNKIRGLLCDLCNRGLGYFKEDIKYIESALKYLKSYEN